MDEPYVVYFQPVVVCKIGSLLDGEGVRMLRRGKFLLMTASGVMGGCWKVHFSILVVTPGLFKVI